MFFFLIFICGDATALILFIKIQIYFVTHKARMYIEEKLLLKSFSPVHEQDKKLP